MRQAPCETQLPAHKSVDADSQSNRNPDQSSAHHTEHMPAGEFVTGLFELRADLQDVFRRLRTVPVLMSSHCAASWTGNCGPSLGAVPEADRTMSQILAEGEFAEGKICDSGEINNL